MVHYQDRKQDHNIILLWAQKHYDKVVLSIIYTEVYRECHWESVQNVYKKDISRTSVELPFRVDDYQIVPTLSALLKSTSA